MIIEIARAVPLWIVCLVACKVSSGATDTAASPTAGAQDGDGGGSKACHSDADCGTGVCEGQGCGDTPGTCGDADRMCTRDAQSYCGCDGVTFIASGSCPARRFEHRGACEGAPPE